MAAVIGLLWRHSDLSQSAISRLTGLSSGMVSLLVSGQTQLTNITKIRPALEALGAPRLVPSFDTKELGERSSGDPVWRLLTEELTTSEGASTGIAAAFSAGSESAPSAEHMLRVFLQMDDQMGGGNLYAPLNQYVCGLAAGADRERGEEFLALGQLSQLAGWLALDAGHHAAARRHFTTAVYIGHEQDALELAASALAYQSLQATYRRKLTEAVALAQTAVGIGAVASPRVRAMLHTRLARAYAARGQEPPCRRSLERAHKAFGEVGDRPEPVWISYVDEVEITAQEGACYLELGRTEAAVGCLTRALALLHEHSPQRLRDQAHYLVRMARCRLADNEVEAACATATHALDTATSLRSPRVMVQLQGFGQELTPWASSPAVRTFVERLRALTPG